MEEATRDHPEIPSGVQGAFRRTVGWRSSLRLTRADPLVRSAAWLWINLAASSVLGALVWVVIARVFSPTEVGAVTSTFAALPLVATAAALGLGETIVRHLHHVPDERRFAIRLTAIAGSVGLGGGLVWWVVTDQVLAEQGIPAGLSLPILALVASCAAAAIVVDGALVALRRPEFLVVESLASVAVRCTAPALVALGAAGLLFAAGSAVIVASVLVAVLTIGILGSGVTRDVAVPRIYHFAAGNWLAGLASLAPRSLTPLLVASMQGAREASWIAIPLLMYPMLTSVSNTMARSMFAEASRFPDRERALVRRAFPRAFGLTALIAVLTVAGAPIVMGLFGEQYRIQSTGLLRLLAVAALVAVPGWFADAILNIRRDVPGYVMANVGGSALFMAVIVAVLPGSPTTLGWAWLAGITMYSALSSGLAFVRRKRISDLGRSRG